ncbi:MAG TPA: hypothetical protein VFC63_25255 [Blastocatellia bacterium]|nr:hypothetical protein [Blastocatellia bacterium]
MSYRDLIIKYKGIKGFINLHEGYLDFHIPGPDFSPKASIVDVGDDFVILDDGLGIETRMCPLPMFLLRDGRKTNEP